MSSRDSEAGAAWRKRSYDAWNRLVAIHRAYHDGNDVQFGSQIQATRYDGLTRRIARATTNTPRDIHKHYVYAGQSVVHVQFHNSSTLIRQMVLACPGPLAPG
ncbi:MAG: hypothetical protein WD316_00010 [Phycisphaeraceae bacterium]